MTLNTSDDGMFGSASGVLVSGDVYYLQVVEDLSPLDDNTNSANGSLTGDIEASSAQMPVQAPEPATAPLLAFEAAFVSRTLLGKRLKTKWNIGRCCPAQ